MDLEGRVTALEDEVNILKGEIKAVLLEVRTAYLAQNNPFTNPAMNNLAALPSKHVEPVTPVATPEPIAAKNGDAPVETPALPAPAPMPATAEPESAKPSARAVEPVAKETALVPAPAPQPVRFDMNTLAMLMAWAQGNMARLNLAEMGSLLALARYGGVIEGELEQILLKIADHFGDDVDPRTGIARQRPAATISEYLLALHELHTVINEEDETAFRWLRKIA